MMKRVVSFTALALTGLSVMTPNALAMGSKPAAFPAIQVKSMKVYENLNLVDQAGRAVTVLADEWEELPAGSTELPPPNSNVDKRLCNDRIGSGTDALLRQTDALLAISNIYTSLGNVYPKQLSPEQIKVIRRTPRCEPFLVFLSGIEKSLQEQGSRADRLRLVRAQPQQFSSVVLGNNSRGGLATLNLVAGGSVQFQLATEVSESVDRVPYGFAYHEATADQTGQNLALVIQSHAWRDGGESEYTYTESCTVTEHERVCRNRHDGRGERCEDVTVTREGTREVRRTNRPEYTDYNIILKKVGGEPVAEVVFEVYDPNRSKDAGPCIANGGRHRDGDWRH